MRQVWIPSCDRELAKLVYKTEAEALKYAMRKASMSCGAICFREVSTELDKAMEQVVEAVRYDTRKHFEDCECKSCISLEAFEKVKKGNG